MAAFLSSVDIAVIFPFWQSKDVVETRNRVFEPLPPENGGIHIILWCVVALPRCEKLGFFPWLNGYEVCKVRSFKASACLHRTKRNPRIDNNIKHIREQHRNKDSKCVDIENGDQGCIVLKSNRINGKFPHPRNIK